ncbi:MAG TPA: DUF262 domain-containing protein [Pyrinomonadaceae bacterium]|jgi:hypothetical protein|nr:DUF262 domain-containing protein [Pyrinomonadaceae bacterium]
MIQVKPHPNKSLLWWYENRHRINMEPEYQRRGGLWPRAKKALLIDSILNELDIPKLYLADFTYSNSKLNEKKTPYAVIDGKQRFEAFWDFIEDKVPLSKEFVLQVDPSIDLRNMRYSEIAYRYPRIIQLFDKYVPSVMSVITDSQHQIDEMFVRLNSGSAITAAEKRNAMPGPIPDLIRAITRHPFFLHNISFETKRMQEFNTVAKILLIESRERFVDTKARNLDGFVKDNAKAKPSDFRQIKATVFETLDLMAKTFREDDPLLGTEGPVPLYYWYFRNEPDTAQYIRPFLKDFVKEIKENLSVSQDNPKEADGELTSYYTMSRTTNDQASLSGRYDILRKRFDHYLKKHK